MMKDSERLREQAKPVHLYSFAIYHVWASSGEFGLWQLGVPAEPEVDAGPTTKHKVCDLAGQISSHHV